ncbi:MAG: 2Fe-2S iron-sulfur cluster-binding protein [Thaumarchaeota archaeon]|nr:2Fe-2S iron-sulfur cluster-binding protein [Nitrososphaerota archaeon]
MSGPPESGRLEKVEGEVIDRAKPVKFEFEGHEMTAFEGDTIASALSASGVDIFSRSFKYHRPRGLLCVSGQCPNCLMNVGGEPNVRACTTEAKDGMKVHRQNAWPSADSDVYSLIQRIDKFMPVGFYYKTFINSPIEWKRVEGRIRKIAGVGSLEEELSKWRAGEAGDEFEQQQMFAQVAVVGGGIAGMMAALEASKLGASVVIVDDQPGLGGHCRFSADLVPTASTSEEEGMSGKAAFQVAGDLARRIASEPGIVVLSDSVAFGMYESNLLAVMQGTKLITLRAEQVIIATGSHEYLPVFGNNDLPGVFLGRGLLRLIRLYGVRPEGKVLVFANNDAGFSAVRGLLEAKIPIAAYVDIRKSPKFDAELLNSLKAQGAQVLLGHAVKELTGGKHVRSAVVLAVDEKGAPVADSEERMSCDTVCVSMGFESEASLLNQSGYGTAFDDELNDFVPTSPKPAIYPCGEVTGFHQAEIILTQGKIAGLTAALNVIDADKKSAEPRIVDARKRVQSFELRLADAETAYRERNLLAKSPLTGPYPLPSEATTRKRFVCVCEDVVEKDLAYAVAEGFEEIETLKRYSTTTMGPCQGKMCSATSIAICARETGRTMAETGRTVSRPPYLATPIGVIAGVEFHPVRLTPMHHMHAQLNPKWMDMGEWKRPFIYSSVEEEYQAVRERVGIIDVSTLGRLDVRGADAPKLLDFIYTHIFSTLKPGKSRYGVICDDAGIILDDGTVTRLSEDHYFVTTTTGNVDFVEQWMTWWATTLGLDAHVTNVTAGLAAVNVAGPKARELLKKLTAIDLSTEAFPYMNGTEGLVAGVPCIMLRIGFVGETGWEIHFPAEFGDYFWEKLMEAGKEFEVRPFGVEAQRILRLEKKHVIVGQDTDALSNPYEADMAWVVKLEKQDFVGKAALQTLQKNPGERRLVGFVMADSAVAHDGDQVYSSDGRSLTGVVTSSRLSPYVGRCVGLALVAAANAKQDEQIMVRSQGGMHGASVTFSPFYDPEGKRLKS